MNDIVYFDNAATSYPKPEGVYYEAYKCMREYCGNPGRGSNKMAIASSKVLFDCRAALKDFFNAPSEENVIFTYNATYALNIAIKCFIPKKSKVLISDIEHNAVYRPIVAQSLKGEIYYDIFPTYNGEPDRIIYELKKRTTCNVKAIVCTAASNICNIHLPIEEIGEFAKERGLLFILDASQLAGHKRIDMKKNGISVLCTPFHKGMYGPQGGGFMIVGEDIKGKSTLIEGGSGYNSKELTMPKNLPERFEAGTVSTPAVAGLLAAVKYLTSAPPNAIERYERQLSSEMKQMLESHEDLSIHGDLCRGSVFSVTSRTYSTEKLGELLDEHGIMIRSGLHCAPLAHKKLGTLDTGTVRFSTGIFNSMADIERLDSVLSKICP